MKRETVWVRTVRRCPVPPCAPFSVICQAVCYEPEMVWEIDREIRLQCPDSNGELSHSPESLLRSHRAPTDHGACSSQLLAQNSKKILSSNSGPT